MAESCRRAAHCRAPTAHSRPCEPLSARQACSLARAGTHLRTRRPGSARPAAPALQPGALLQHPWRARESCCHPPAPAHPALPTVLQHLAEPTKGESSNQGSLFITMPQCSLSTLAFNNRAMQQALSFSKAKSVSGSSCRTAKRVGDERDQDVVSTSSVCSALTATWPSPGERTRQSRIGGRCIASAAPSYHTALLSFGLLMSPRRQAASPRQRKRKKRQMMT